MTAFVAATFAVVLAISCVVFLGWFEGRLLDDVRANDQLEIDRQVEIIEALSNAAAAVPGLITEEDLAEPLDDDDFPVAIIPDDGTVISIATADGVLLTDSSDSFRILTSDTVADENEPPRSGSGDELSPTELQQAVTKGPELLSTLRNELSAATLEEYALVLRLLDDAFPDPATTQDELDANLELNLVMNQLFFGFDDRSSAGAGPTITTTQVASIVDIPVTIRATSNISDIDAALSDITQTMWVAGPLLVALAAGLTFLATGRALQPVDAMTRRVDAITSARSGDRVPEPDTGDEINQLAVTMNGMLDRLESSAQSQRQFVSDVSHELRTPAAVIRAEIEAGLAETDNDWPKTAESVLAEQTRLSGLVDDLLLLARMDEGGPTHRVDIDLDALVQAEAARGWAHHVDVGAVEPTRMRGDERQISRLIQNLVANANRHATSTVALTLRSDGARAVLWVDDDGRGVPATERDRVFERFARLDESRERDLGGSGLGLAIVREVAEAHGGSASITNSPLGGARVEVRLAL